MKTIDNQPAPRAQLRGEIQLRSGGHVDVSGPCSRRVLGGLRILASHVGRHREGIEQPSPAVRLNRGGM